MPNVSFRGFKRDDRIVWFDMDEFTIDEVVEDILHRIEAALMARFPLVPTAPEPEACHISWC